MKQRHILTWAVLLCICLLAACQRAGPEADFSAQSPPPAIQPEPEPELPPVPDPIPVPEPEPEPVPEPPSTPEPEPLPVPEPESEPPPDPPNTRLYVLMYHHFIPEGQPYNNWMLTDTRFREDLQWLADHGWTTVLPSQLVSQEPLPNKAVMLTFDDGYRSNYQLAYPLLQGVPPACIGR